MAKKKNGLVTEAQKTIFPKFIRFLVLQKDSTEKSAKEYIREIEKFQGFIGFDVTDLKPYGVFADKILEYQEANLHTTRNRFKYVSMISVYFYFCALHEIISSPHILSLGHGFEKGKSPEKEFFDREVDSDILNKILWNPYVHSRDRCLLFMFFSTGLRPSEMCYLNIDDIDFNNKWVHVRQECGKGEKERYVPFDEMTYRRLCLYMEELEKSGCIDSKKQPLFTTKEGGRMKPNSIWKIFYNIGHNLNVKMNPYKWRHSFASFVTQKAGIAAAAKLCGHESISTTQGYSHYKPQTLQKIYNDITAPIESGKLKILVPEILTA